MPRNLVPNKEIREAFIRSGLNVNDVANFCGWLKNDGMPDTTRVGRMLGLVEATNKRGGGKYFQNQMAESSALQIIEAIGLDPVDFRESGL